MKFDVIVGNPPYNNRKMQIYPLFYLWAKDNCDYMSMIFPTGWQEPKGGNGLKFMNTPEVKYDKQIVSIDNIVDGFKGVIGAKNTNIIYWKKGYDNGLDGKQLVYRDGSNPQEIKFLISKSEIKIPDEIIELSKCVGDCTGMDTVITNRVPYNLQTNFFNEPEKYNLPDTFKIKKDKSGDIRIFGKLNNVRVVRYVDEDYPLPKPHIDCHKGVWKILLPKTWGSFDKKYLGGTYGDIIIVGPNDICTDNYLESGYCKDFEEAKKHSKYCMSKFARALLIINKFSYDNIKSVWKSVPIQDYTEDFWNSDNIDEIDNGLFDKYSVPEGIRKFVKENIQPKTVKNILGYDGKDIDLSKVKKEDTLYKLIR